MIIQNRGHEMIIQNGGVPCAAEGRAKKDNPLSLFLAQNYYVYLYQPKLESIIWFGNVTKRLCSISFLPSFFNRSARPCCAYQLSPNLSFLSYFGIKGGGVVAGIMIAEAQGSIIITYPDLMLMPAPESSYAVCRGVINNHIPLSWRCTFCDLQLGKVIWLHASIE